MRLTLLAAFCHIRQTEITDALVELLLESVHRIGARAEKKVEKKLLADFKRVRGKNAILLRMAETALAHPEGKIREVLFPVVSEETLRELVRELRSTRTYSEQVQLVMRGSYGRHYRRVLPRLIGALEPEQQQCRPPAGHRCPGSDRAVRREQTACLRRAGRCPARRRRTGRLGGARHQADAIGQGAHGPHQL